jgi:hypothetical protein
MIRRPFIQRLSPGRPNAGAGESLRREKSIPRTASDMRIHLFSGASFENTVM